jgi:hypothetical protein
MSGNIEFGKCEICGKMKVLQRTYFNYNIKCECHSPNHFELVIHCADCIPTEPVETKIVLKTSTLCKVEDIGKVFIPSIPNGFRIDCKAFEQQEEGVGILILNPKNMPKK